MTRWNRRLCLTGMTVAGLVLFPAAGGNSQARPQTREAHPTVRCATPPLQAWHRPQSAEAGSWDAVVAYEEERPTADVVDSVCPEPDSGDAPLCVHTTTGGRAELAETVYDLAQQAWDIEVDIWDFRPPLYPNELAESDGNLDIYLTSAGGTATSVPEPSCDPATATDIADACAYILIDELTEPEILGSVVAHQLHHAVQFAYDTVEHPSAYEMTSVFVEKRVFPESDHYVPYINEFQSLPDRALDWLSETSTAYRAGSAAFLFYASQRFGGGDVDLIRRMWENSEQASETNDLHYFDALEAVLPASLSAAYAEFAGWRAFTGENATPELLWHGADWQSPDIAATHGLAGLPVTETASGACSGCTPPMEYGANYIAIDTSGGVAGDRLVAGLEARAGQSWALSVAGVPRQNEQACLVTVEAADDGTAGVYVDGVNRYRRIFIVPTRLAEDRNPNEGDYNTADYSYRIDYALEADDLPVVDLEGCDPVIEPPACACHLGRRANTPGLAVLALWLAAAVVAARRRALTEAPGRRTGPSGESL